MAAVVAMLALRAALVIGISITVIACGQRNMPPVEGSGAPKPAFSSLSFHPATGGPEARFETRFESRTVSLAEPDDPANPKAWEGPLKVADLRSGSECHSGISLITGVYASPGLDFLIVLSYSGSLRYVHYVDIKSCKEKWASLEVFTEEIQVSGDLVTIQPACECPGASAPCDCSSARVLRLAANQAPSLLNEASRALTKKVLGVEFEGRRKVLKPKSPSAELVSARTAP